MPTDTSAPSPLHARLMPLGAALLLAALVADVAYVKTFALQWATFSVWLITGGLLLAAVAGLALLIDLIALRRRLRLSWLLLTCAVAAVVLSVLNAFVHSRDGYTAVAPTGLTLSVIVALLLLVLGVNGWSVMRRLRYAHAG